MSEQKINESTLSVKERVAKVKHETKVDKGVLTFEDKNSYLDGLTEEQKASIQFTKSYDEEFIAGATLAVGELAIEEFGKNKELEHVNAKFKTVGRDEINIRVDRKRENVNPMNREQTIVKYANVSVDHKRVATNKNAGQLKEVQKHLNESAASKLAAEALSEA